MIIIDNVELSKNPVTTSEVFIIKVTAREVMANWEDTKLIKWENFETKTWNMLKRKIFQGVYKWQYNRLKLTSMGKIII